MPSWVPAATIVAAGDGRLLVDEETERALAIMASVDARTVRQRLPRATHPPLSRRRRSHGLPHNCGPMSLLPVSVVLLRTC